MDAIADHVARSMPAYGEVLTILAAIERIRRERLPGMATVVRVDPSVPSR